MGMVVQSGVRVLKDNVLKSFLGSTEFRDEPTIYPADPRDSGSKILKAFNAGAALMGHGESFTFFVRIPFLWFEPDSNWHPVYGAENEMDLSQYHRKMENRNFRYTKTAIKVYHAWFVILNNRRVSINLYQITNFLPLTSVLNRGSIDSHSEIRHSHTPFRPV
jgi:hypothetical protein